MRGYKVPKSTSISSFCFPLEIKCLYVIILSETLFITFLESSSLHLPYDIIQHDIRINSTFSPLPDHTVSLTSPRRFVPILEYRTRSTSMHCPSFYTPLTCILTPQPHLPAQISSSQSCCLDLPLTVRLLYHYTGV